MFLHFPFPYIYSLTRTHAHTHTYTHTHTQACKGVGAHFYSHAYTLTFRLRDIYFALKLFKYCRCCYLLHLMQLAFKYLVVFFGSVNERRHSDAHDEKNKRPLQSVHATKRKVLSLRHSQCFFDLRHLDIFTFWQINCNLEMKEVYAKKMPTNYIIIVVILSVTTWEYCLFALLIGPILVEAPRTKFVILNNTFVQRSYVFWHVKCESIHTLWNYLNLNHILYVTPVYETNLLTAHLSCEVVCHVLICYDIDIDMLATITMGIKNPLISSNKHIHLHEMIFFAVLLSSYSTGGKRRWTSKTLSVYIGGST